MSGELQDALRDVRATLLSNPVSPRVERPADINRHYCTYVARTVADRVGGEVDVEILADGGQGHVHTWLHHDGSHYDAECVEGVADYRDLPFFQRHPEAAVHVETDTANRASLRQRGRAPLYPAVSTVDSPGDARPARTSYRRFALVGLLLGVALVLTGLTGGWILHRQTIAQSAQLRVLFVDLEIVGELLLVVSSIVFLVRRPTHRSGPT